MKSQARLYHSVSRGGDIEQAIRTLSTIVDIGFVLSPEVVRFTEQTAGPNPRILALGQKRMCFTNISERELHDHSKTFGPITIEFDLDQLSAAGATPVFYVPPTSDESGAAGLAAALLVHLADVANLTREIAEIRDQMVGKAGQDYFNLDWNGNKAQIHVSELSAVVAYLEHRHGNARELHNNLRGLAQLFYPTDDPRYVSKLAYYRQHEWRIIGDIAFHGVPLCRLLTEAEKVKLLAANEPFFGKNIELLTGSHRRVDECRLYVPPNVRNAMDMVTGVYAPDAVIDRVTTILKQYGLLIPIKRYAGFSCGK